jgi:hypothetical protein
MKKIIAVLFIAFFSGAWVIKDTANPVDIYTGSNTTPSISAATNGVLTLGPVGSTQTHTVYGQRLDVRADSGSPALRFNRNGTQAFWMESAGIDNLTIYNGAGSTSYGSIISGAWTIGPSGFTGDHTINGSLILAGKVAGGPAATMIGVSGSVDDGLKLQRTAGLPTQVGYVSQRGGALRFTSREDSNYGGFVFTQWNGTTEINAGIVDGTGIWKNAAGTWTVSSDKRLKKNIVTMEGALDRINALHPVTFDWIEDKPAVSKPRAGFIAQEVENIMPGIVKKSSYTYKKDGQEFSIKDAKHLDLGSEMFANLVQAIQELSAENDALKFRLTSLEADRKY